MNKKEEIKHLKLQNKCLESRLKLAIEVLEPIEKQSSQRGARMQIMYEYLCHLEEEHWFVNTVEFDDWFDKDGVPLK